MTAKGKINASTVTAGDRIIVKLHRNDAGLLTHISESRTKTGEDVLVVRVTGKTFRGAQGRYEARGKYVIETTAGAFEAAPIQTMWLAPEDTAGIERARKEALLEDEEWHRVANALAVLQAEELAHQENAARDAAADQAELDVPDTDPLEAEQVVDTHSVAATSEAYWTKGCGAQVLETTAKLCEQDEIRRLREEFPTASEERKAEIQVRLAILGTVVYPEGTPEYEEFRAKLRAALADWVDEGRKSVVADVEVVRDEGGQPRQVAVTRVPDSGYPSTSYVPVELPRRVPGAALADAMVQELVEDMADVALAEATREEAHQHALRHARHARPGHTAQVQLLPLRDEYVDLASAELMLAVGAEWGRLEGKWLRVAAIERGDLEDGTPLFLLEAGTDEPRWWNAGQRSRRTGYVALVGKTMTVNSRPYEVRPNAHGSGLRLYPA